MRKMVATSFLTVTFLVSVTSSVVQAQRSDDERARLHFESGRVHYEEGAYDRALVEFESAYALAPHPLLLLNLANSHQQLGHPEKAAAFIREYLSAVPDTPNRAQLERRASNLERLAAQQGSSSTGGAGPESTPPPGSETSEATTSSATLSRAERRKARSQLVLAENAPEAESSKSPRGVMPYVLLGAGGAVAVAGGVMLGIGLSDKAQVENPPEGSRDWREDSAARDARGPALLTTGVLALPVGVLTAAAGVVWMLKTQPKKKDADPEAAGVELGLGATSVTLRGRF